jgi:hypothetical protein
VEYSWGVEWRDARRVRRGIDTEREREIQAIVRDDGVKDSERNEKDTIPGT